MLKPEAAINLMGANYAVVSIILIYHLSALQHWLTRVEDAVEEAMAHKESKVLNPAEFAYLKSRYTRRVGAFPWNDVVILGILIVTMAVLSYIESRYARPEAARLFTLAPVGVMMIAYGAGTWLAWHRGERKARQISAELTPPQR